MNKLLQSIVFAFFSIGCFAQVTSVNYQLEYDFENDLYNCYLIVIEGEAIDSSDRVGFNSQFTIVTPFGAELNVVESFMPLIDQDPNRPTTWFNAVSWDYPEINSEYSYFTINPFINPIASYNELVVDDKVKLFSFELDSIYGCDDVYIWRNGIEPSSSDPDMAGLDLNNGFSMGSATQIYSDNAPKKVGTPFVRNSNVTCGNDVTVVVEIAKLDCHGAISYQWSGPQGFSSSDQNLFIANFDQNSEGLYVLNMIDGLGQESLPFFVELPGLMDAGEDKVGCLRVGTMLDTLKGSSTFEGFWTFGNGTSLDTPRINAIGNGMAVIEVDSAGTYEFIYGGTGCPDTMVYEIKKAIVPEIVGDTVICVLGLTQVSPNTGGTWTSEDPLVCSVSNIGLVTGLSPGEATLIFTPSASNYCPSEPSYPITVLPEEDLTLTGPNRICIGQTTTIEPSAGGSWVSSNPTVCTITNAGVITGLSQGSAIFTFANSSGCIMNSEAVVVDPNPTILVEIDTLCLGTTSNAMPSSGGIWTSSNSSVCVISNAGVITPISPGSCILTYTEAGTGCISDSEPILVLPTLEIEIFTDEICIGDTTRLSPQSGGAWVSSDNNIATIGNSGLATGISAGVVTFQFTDEETLCNSMPSELLTVNPLPMVEFRGVDTISVNQTTVVFPDIGGTWVSSDVSVAIVNNLGIVSGIAEGEAQLYFIDDNGCTSAELTIVVEGCGTISTTEEEIFIGDTIQLYSTAIGTWSSSDTNVVKVLGDKAVGIALGIVNLSFTTMDTCTYDNIQLKVIEPTNLVIINTFIDLNDNSIYDANIDEQLPNVVVQIPSLNSTFITNQDGLYQKLLDTGSYEMTFTVPYGNWTEDQKVFQVEVYESEVYVFVGFTPAEDEDEANVIIGSDRLRCDSIANLNLTLFNKGNTILNGNLHLVIDNKSGILQSVPFPSATNGNELTFAVQDLSPGNNFSPIVDIAVGNPAFIGDVLTFNAYFVYENGDTVSNIIYTDSIRCSFDPNDKRSWPDRGGIKRTLIDESIDYTIRFQNTGNDAAYRVEIKDVLDTNLNPLTVIVKESSHNVETSILGDTLCFVFDNIVLPDSTSDFEGSQGFISFEVKAKKGLSDSIRIENKANIIFDSNPPIETNTTHNTMVEDFICFYDSLSYTICAGDTIFTTENVYTEFGIYEEVRIGEGGCDTLVNIELIAGEKVLITGPDISICIGSTTAIFDSFTVLNYTPDILETSTDGKSITAIAAGIGKVSLETDSIMCPSDTLFINVNPIPNITSLTPDTLCVGDVGKVTSDVSGTWFSSNDSIVSINNNGEFTGVNVGESGLVFTDEVTGCSSEKLQFTVVASPSDSIWTDEFQIYVNSDGIQYAWYICGEDEPILTTNEPSFAPDENGSYFAIITSTHCSVQTDCIDFIKSNTKDDFQSIITVYPNPVQDILQIRTEQQGKLMITNISGEETMMFDKIPTSVDLRGLNSGAYILKFEIQGNQHYYKIVKK